MESSKNKLVDYIERAKKILPNITNDMLVENGTIYYRNGNDGTDWDWDENNRSCEFMSFYESSGLGIVKVFFTRRGYIEGYAYPNEGKGEAIALEKEYIGIQEIEDIIEKLYRQADLKYKWNCSIDELDF
jgi:hypothetical protein